MASSRTRCRSLLWGEEWRGVVLAQFLHQNWAGTHGGALTQPLGSWLSRFVGIGELDLCAPGAEGAWSMQGCCRDKMRAGRKCLLAGSFTSARSAQV